MWLKDESQGLRVNRYAGRRNGWASLVLGLAVVAALLAACGSDSPEGGSRPTTAPTSMVPPTSAPTTTTAPVTYTTIGTLVFAVTKSTGGGTASLTYSVGKPITGDAPPPAASAALSSCDIGTLTTRGSIYVPGDVQVTFEGGPYPEKLSLRGGDITGAAASTNEHTVLREAIDVDGSWSCGQTHGLVVTGSGAYEVTFDPNQRSTFPVWVFAIGGINNEAPTFNAATNIAWSFTGATLSVGPGAKKSGSGPHVYTCGLTGIGSVASPTTLRVSLFGSPPLTLNFDRRTITCRSPS